jgi:hypothetical protein
MNGDAVYVENDATFPYSNATFQDSNKFDIFSDIPNTNGIGRKEFLGIASISKKTATQSILTILDPVVLTDSAISHVQELRRTITNADFYNIIIGGDNRCERFMPDSNDLVNNWIRVTHEENNYGIVDGEFNMKLIKIRDCPDRNYPDTLYFTEGKFHLNLKE